MTVTSGMYSSLRGTWKTPAKLYALLTANRTDVTDGVPRDVWPEPWFANPPYGRHLGDWTQKMVVSGRGVALLPARTDTRWFHEDVLPYARIEWLRGRLHFDDAGPAPFPSMLCWYGGEV